MYPAKPGDGQFRVPVKIDIDKNMKPQPRAFRNFKAHLAKHLLRIAHKQNMNKLLISEGKINTRTISLTNKIGQKCQH